MFVLIIYVAKIIIFSNFVKHFLSNIDKIVKNDIKLR